MHIGRRGGGRGGIGEHFCPRDEGEHMREIERVSE